MQQQSRSLSITWAIVLTMLMASCASRDEHVFPTSAESFPRYCHATNGVDRFECVVSVNKRLIDTVYQQHLRETPGLSGKVVFAFSVDADGKAHYVKVEQNQTRDPDFADDLAKALKELNYGPFDKAGIYRYQMEFYQ